jgi:hypothetical protein
MKIGDEDEGNQLSAKDALLLWAQVRGLFATS